MLELLAVWLVLGGLTGIARGRWRLSELARATLIWPLMLPELLRSDPSPPDPPALQDWRQRIAAATDSLQLAIDQGRMLGNEDVGRRLLTDTRSDLEAVARRHAELDQLLADPAYDLDSTRTALARLEPDQAHRRPALQTRLGRIAELHQAQRQLEARLEEGMAEVMSLAARLHLARATGAPVQAVQQDLQSLAEAVGGVEEAEGAAGIVLDADEVELLSHPQPQPEEPPAAQAETARFAEPDDDLRHRFEQAVQSPTPELPVPVDEQAWRPPGQEPLLEESWSARMTMVAVIAALTLGSVFYRVLVMGGLEQSSALFIGLPALLAMVVALLPSGRYFTTLILKVISLMLLLSGIALAEGFICIVMAAPVFYAVGVLMGLLLDLLRAQSRARRMVAFLPVALLSLEGVDPAVSLDRAEVVTTQRVVAGSPAEVHAGLAAPLAFDQPLPFLMRLGFPRPEQALGHGLQVGDRRVVHLAGGEGHPGDLVLEVAESGPGHVRFVALSDSSHVAHWLAWQEAEVHWQSVGPHRTAVRWTLRYRRDLDPALWFGPVERQVVGMTADYLMDCLLPPELPDADA